MKIPNKSFGIGAGLALGMLLGVNSAAFAADCYVTTSTNPDAYITGARGGDEGIGGDNAANTGRYSASADCGLGIDVNSSVSNVAGFGGVEYWDFYGKYDASGNEGSTAGWSVTGYSDDPTGTWSIDSSQFTDGTQFLLVLKDGVNANEPDYDNTMWVWFIIGPDTGSDMNGTWSMYSNRENSHVSLYTVAGNVTTGHGVPEPNVLMLLGAGLIGLGYARHRNRKS
jgi:hypothetical protein